MQQPLLLWRRLVLLALALGTGYTSGAQVVPQPVALTGFNADIVANGSGNTTAGSSSNSSVDANSYVFLSNDYTTTTAPGFFHPSVGLPFGRTFQGAGTATPSVLYRLQSYAANNTLRLYGVGGSSPVATATGTLSFATPAPAGTLYVLATSGSGADATTAVVNFADGSSQSFSFTVQDWFSGTPYAYSVSNRLLLTSSNFDALTANATAQNPRLYQYALTLSAANAGKNITGVTFTKSTTAGTYVQIMAISAAPATTNTYTPMVLTFPAGGAPAPYNGSTFATPSANGQDIIANGLSGNTITTGNATTPYTNTSATADTDGAGYFLVATDYNKNTSAHDAYGLPVAGINGATTTGLLTSLSTSGLTYQLADYNGINALQLRGVGSGAVSFTGASATEVYVLTTSTNGSTVTGGTLTVNFADGSSHAYAVSYTNWFTSTSSTATQTTAGVTVGVYAKGRLQPGNTVQTSTTTPYLFENKLLLSPAEYGKTITGVTLSNPSSGGAVSLLGVTLNTNTSSVPQCALATGHSTTASVAAACAGTSFNLNVLGLAATVGYSYQWQYSTDNATWNNLSTSTAASPYSTNPTGSACTVLNQTSPTYYRCLVQCTYDPGNTAAPSAAVQVGQTDPINCYPYPNVSTSGCSSFGSVTAVRIAETATPANVVLNKTGLSCAATTEPYSTYGIFRDASSNGTLDKAKDYTLTVTVANSSRLGVWIDLNRDGVFNGVANSAGTPTGEYLGTTNLTASTGGTLTLTIPATALATVTNGAVGLRIRTESGSASVLSTAGNNNATTTYGLTLDYAVLVAGATPCAGTPAATAPTASAATACPSTTFTLTAQGPAAGTTGLTYQWEYKPSTGSAFVSVPATLTDVSGNAVTTNSTTATLTITNQRAATDYRVIITCTNGGASATSPVTTVAQSTLANCYCQNSNNATNEYITNVTLQDINNTSGSSQSNTPTGYIDYSGSPTATQTTTLTRSGSYSISVTALSASTTPTEMVWIDYDQSGTFDASEYTLIGTQSTTGSVTGTATLSIPATALLGPTRMRVRMHNDATGNSGSACANAWNGETEDYLVTIGAAQVCAGTPPTPAATATASTVCAGTSFTLNATGLPNGTTGFTYQWQSSPAGAGTFANISGATTIPYSVASQTAATDYRLVVTCTNSGLTAASNTVSVAQNGFLSCYCTPTYSSGGSTDNVTRVRLGVLDNNTAAAGNPAPYYHDYAAAQTGPSASLQVPVLYTGGNADVTLNFGTDGNQHAAVWIDFNQNGVFGDVANEFVATTANAGASGSVTLTLVVPASAVPGTTKMRIRGGDDTNDPTIGQACGASGSSFGEAEDYLVTIAAPVACSGAPATTTAAASAATVCVGTSFTLSATGIAPGTTGLTYQWQSSPAGAGTFADISGATAAPYTVASQSAATDYRLVVTCTSSGQASTSNVVSVGQNAFVNCYCTPVGGVCTNEYIRGVTLNTLSNLGSGSSGTGCTSGGYADYTGNAALTTTLNQGATYALGLNLRINSNPAAAGVWIDYDHSGTFDASEFVQIYSNTAPASALDVTASANITIPSTALTGVTRMRVRSANSSVPLSATAACPPNPAYGEVEDYLVTISSAAPDLVISTAGQTIGAGTYNSITVQSGGVGTLTGNVTVNTSLTVQSGGTLQDGCAIISGAGSFALAAGGTLGICNAAGIASSGATGAVQVTGTRSFSPDASYIYNGTAAQVTGSALPAQVRNLTTTNASAVTLSGPTSAAQVVTVGGAGNLVLNGNALTLLSSAAGTALIVNSGAGVVQGSTGVAQRYIDGTQNSGLGYRHYAAPVSGSTVADLATSGFAPVVNPAYNTSATSGRVTPYPTVFGYDQSRLATSPATTLSAFDKGWASPASTGTPLVVGQGYTVNLGAGQLVDFVGTFTTGDLTLNLSRGTDANAGWQLLGNPYPAPLDLGMIAAADRPNLDAAAYVFASSGQYAGSYRSYVRGVGGNPVVPLGQGFFARVAAGQTNGAVTFRNSQRLTSPDATPFQCSTNDPRPLVQLDLRTSTGQADALFAYAETGASAVFDGQFDALKLPNTTGLNLSSTAASGEALAIDGRPGFSLSTVLPLSVGVPAAGTYTLVAEQLRNLPAGLQAYLTDAATGQSTALTVGTRYSFSVTAAQAQALITGRFALRFSSALASSPAAALAGVSLFPNPTHALCTVRVPGVGGATTVQAEVLNALGQVVARQQATLPANGTTLTFDTRHLATGVYVVRLQAGSASVVKRLVVE